MTLEEKFGKKKRPERERVNFMIDKDVLDIVDEIAEDVGVGRSDVLRVFVNDGVTDSGYVGKNEDK